MAESDFSLLHTQVALFDSAMFVQQAWIAVASDAKASSSYVRGLQQRGSLVYPDGGNVLAARVVNVAPEAAQEDEGRPGFHLPSRIRWGSTPASRLSKKGVWYIRVPMSHKTRSMPRGVYPVAKQLQAGQRLTAGPSAGRAVHAPGLQPYVPRLAANRRPGYTHAALQEGMRRGPGRGGRRLGYVTFRTMTQNSSGWNIPARPGLHLAAQVSQRMLPEVQRQLEAAFLLDVEAAVRQQLRP